METIIFETDEFNLSKEYDHFINPCCFGEDVSNWLKPFLENIGIEVNDIYQEDWGWKLSCKSNGRSYYLGVSGISEEDCSDLGEWRVMITKRRSLIEGILGKNKLSRNETIIAQIANILQEAGFAKVRYEENA